jgi:hypothetical protein
MNAEAHWYSGHRRVPAREEHQEKRLAQREVLSLRVPAWRPLTCTPGRGRDDRLGGYSIHSRQRAPGARKPKQVTPGPRKSTCRLRTAMSRTGFEQFDGCSAAISVGHKVTAWQRRRRLGNGARALTNGHRSTSRDQGFTGASSRRLLPKQRAFDGRSASWANYGFDVTPARLVTGLITERGVLAASRAALARAFPDRAAAAE